MAELVFPPVATPIVSVVMVTHNAADWAARALRALLDHTEPCYELIVVDNDSADGTAELLGNEVEGASVLLNEENRGFGPANNQGAARAVGRYVVFLNNDALVRPGWLPPLLARIESRERIGAVGPPLLNLDGSLQLAGAIVARSGSTLELGYGEPADAPEYRFPRVVDYLSAACLLVRRSAFDQVGGFDPAYGLAYFEDADLCLSLADRGYEVVYEPQSSVTHVRGASPRGKGLSMLAPRNRSLFQRRWSHVLAARPLAPLGPSRRRTLAARDAPARERILVVGDQGEALAGAAWTCRVTAVADEPGPADERLIEAGVELVREVDDWRAWFDDRRFHYDVVVAPDPAGELDEHISRTQPQAVRISPDEAEQIELLAARCGGFD